MSAGEGSTGQAGGAGRVARARDAVCSLVDQVPGVRRILTEVVRVEFLDRSMVIAAQALFSVTPLLVVFAAYAPHKFNASILDEVTSLLGIKDSDAGALNTTTVEQVRTQTGAVGILLVVFSALSFAGAFQRLYERVWERRHHGGLVGYRRRLWWMIAWLTALQLLNAVLNAVAGSGYGLFRLILQIVASTGLWWWTPHTLLLGGVPWRSLWPGALLTATGISVAVQISHLVMPNYVRASVNQFGGLGLMLAASTWLLALGGVVVMAAILGRVLSEEPRLRPPPGWLQTLKGGEPAD
jgi:membrane protein